MSGVPSAVRDVVFAVPSPREDTPERMSFVKRLAKGIEALGTRVHLMRVVRSANPLEFVRQGLALRRLTRETNASVVVAQYGSYTGLLVALFGPRPIVITYRGSDLNPEPNTHRLMQMAQHAASQCAAFFADGIICVSRELAGRLLKPGSREIIPSPTDVDLFQPLNQAACRAQLAWSIDRPVAVFLGGKNATLKGVELARRVQGELARRHPFMDLQILDEEVPLPDVPAYLNAADCLLFLSRYEGSPNLIREACACNLPIVTLPSGDIADVLAEVRPSRIVRPEAGEIADALADICRLPVRSNGRATAMRYATDIVSRRSLAFYETISRVSAQHRGQTS